MRSFCRIGWLALLLLIGCNQPWLGEPAWKTSSIESQSDSSALKVDLSPDPSAGFFELPAIVQLHLRLDPAAAETLRRNGREYVKCELAEDGGPALSVGIKLKGAAGSYRELDDKPAITVNVVKFQKQQRFHALKKFYLNNSVQDESYYAEWLSSIICQQINLPAPRITFAHLWLNDRDLGLYVLKEGFDDLFISRHFDDPDGVLYDGGFCQDIDVELEIDKSPSDIKQPGISELRDACWEPNPDFQQTAVGKVLDVDAFINFMAFEMMACHWDGYVGNTNNYRIYFPPTSGAWFLPHGMDQMFQDSEYSIFEPRASIVGRSVRQHSEWNQKFRQRVRELLPQFEPQQLTHRLEQLEQRLRPEFVKLDPDCEPHRDQILADWRERLFRRYSSIEEQLALPDPAEPTDQQHELLELPPGQVLELSDWYPRQESEDATLSADVPEQQTDQEPDTALVYSISAGDSGQCIASWRRAVLLPAGKYRVAAEMKVWGVVPIRDERGRGAGLRISGASREQSLEGSGAWQTVEFEFSLAEDFSFVEFVSELRAAAGVSQMRRPSLTRLELP